jgi:hypothetical protein
MDTRLQARRANVAAKRRHRVPRVTELAVLGIGEPLTQRLAKTAVLWQAAVAPVVERVAHALHRSGHELASIAPKSLPQTNRSSRDWRKPPTRLTQTNRLLGATNRRTRELQRVCLECGVIFEGDKRGRQRYCRDCIAVRRHERAVALGSKHPTYAQRWRMRADDAPDPEQFRAGVLPKLQRVMLRDIGGVMGVSLSLASKVRSGKTIPHPKHWEALSRLASSDPYRADSFSGRIAER